MTDNYYLINNEIRFYFDIEKQYLEFKGETESLEPKEAQILKYILENSIDGIIKSENILDNNWDYWNDKKVLQKVLSTLRKKFKNIDVIENGFVAAGSNYKINYVGVFIDLQSQLQEEKNSHKQKIITSVRSALLWGIIGAVTLMLITKWREGPKLTIDRIIQATAITGVSSHPDLSPDGSALAFSQRQDGFAQIYLKMESSLNFQVLTKQHYDQSPAWSPSGQRLAFQRFENGICEIRLINFDRHYDQNGNDEKIAECDENTAITSIAWKTENQLFFTDDQMIKLLDLKTRAITPYFSYPEDSDYLGSGHYYIVYNKEQRSLYSLESPNWASSTINKIHSDNTVTKLHEVNDIVISIDIFENHMIFRDLDNQLKAFSLDDSSQLITIYKNPLKPIAYPTVSADSNKIAIVSGNIYKNNIYAMSLKNNEIAEIISSQFNLAMPQQVDNEIFFISKETGISQLYAFSNNIRSQLSNFLKNRNIIYFTISNDNRWVAINFIDSTVLYKRHKNGLTAVNAFPLMTYPAFSLNSKRILLTNLVKTIDSGDAQWKQELIEYSLDDFSETGITVKNAHFGIYHQSGILFSATDEPSIKLFTLEGVKFIVKVDEAINLPSLLAANQDSIFISTGAQTHKLNLKDEKKQLQLMPGAVKGSIAVNDDFIYFKGQAFGNMDIFTARLTKH